MNDTELLLSEKTQEFDRKLEEIQQLTFELHKIIVEKGEFEQQLTQLKRKNIELKIEKEQLAGKQLACGNLS